MQACPLKKALDKHNQLSLIRKREVIGKRHDAIVSMHGKNIINFTSNDYLNLASHPDVKKAFIQGVECYGLGSGSASFVSGYSRAHQQLEEAFCEFLNRDRAILFNSGYHANLGVLTALSRSHAVIIADKLCHASIIDGILLSRAKHYRYRHRDLNHAKYLVNLHKNSLLVTESVFSMEGDITDLPILSALNSLLIVDDAHGIGVLGNHGKGICEFQHLTQHQIPCLITPLGKALGSFGAIVSGENDIIETILQFARTYCFTTALPPAISHATLMSLKLLQQETWRRETLHHLIDFFITNSHARGLNFVSTDKTPIKSILVNSNTKALDIQKKLLEKNLFVSCIRPPTVPKNTARIRISLNCSHTEIQITQLLDEIYHLL